MFPADRSQVRRPFPYRSRVRFRRQTTRAEYTDGPRTARWPKSSRRANCTSLQDLRHRHHPRLAIGQSLKSGSVQASHVARSSRGRHRGNRRPQPKEQREHRERRCHQNGRGHTDAQLPEALPPGTAHAGSISGRVTRRSSSSAGSGALLHSSATGASSGSDLFHKHLLSRSAPGKQRREGRMQRFTSSPEPRLHRAHVGADN